MLSSAARMFSRELAYESLMYPSPYSPNDGPATTATPAFSIRKRWRSVDVIPVPVVLGKT